MVDTRRIRVVKEGVAGTGPVVYVMAREQRVADNWALLYAQEEAHTHKVPLIVLFCIGEAFLDFSERHNVWLITSLKNIADNLAKKNIPFLVVHGDWARTVSREVNMRKATCVVFDQNPLEPVRTWRREAAVRITAPVYEVDAHNIIPVWFASDKAEFAAYTFRPKVRRLYREFAGDIPAVKKQTALYTEPVPPPDWEALRRVRTVSAEAPMPEWITPGEHAARTMLRHFVEDRLSGYAPLRNDPTLHAQSDLSPYIRWGNISAQRIAYTAEGVTGVSGESKKAFLEELVVRRELAENFVYYTKAYNTISGAHAWAQKTIEEHRSDPRAFLYSYDEFAAGKTHDALWNAAQREMVMRGKMHGFMRMYWAKKILEWTESPEEALTIALRLNDIYELDGRDPNGVTGVMWSIAGVHDRAWFDRPIFGKIRYMNEAGCRRKFDVDAYIAAMNALK